jgi:Dolichyl-phosphate-mannose-protein mannosyltransferase
MTDSAEATRISALRTPSLREALAARWFPLGVAAIAAAAGTFFVLRLQAWPPHEDETLALFVGRNSLGGALHYVTHDRGGAPLHFLVAWVVAHLGFGLDGLRLVSAAFAVAALVATAALVARLADRRTALLSTALAAGTWLFLFQGLFARMYSLFLLTATLAALALLRALASGRRRDWALWVLAILAAVATHPYGVLVLGAHGLFVVLAHRGRLRQAIGAFAVVLVAGVPFWLTDLVLAGRFDVGVGGGGAQLGSPRVVALYLWWVAGDLAAGWTWVLVPVLLVGAVGLLVMRRETLAFTTAMVVAPVAAFLLAHLGSSASPQTRHLIFVLPFFAMAVSTGLLRLGRRVPVLVAVAAIALLAAEGAWTKQRTPALVTGEPHARIAARHQASAWLAATSRPNDLLFGYEPLYLGAWERNHRFASTVIPRADPILALRTLRDAASLGRGVFVLDGSDPSNVKPTSTIEAMTPSPQAAFEVKAFGPFLVIRTRKPTETPAQFLAYAQAVQRMSYAMGIAHAGVNLDTIKRAEIRLAAAGKF